MSTRTTTEERKCGSCQKAQSQLSEPMKSCAKCKKAYYCSRECQVKDWKAHKSLCHPKAASQPTSTSMPCLISRPFTALQNGTWLHGRPEKDVYQLLIDTYRLRREDKYKFEGEVDEGCIYAGAGPASALLVFKRFLKKIVDLDAARPSNKKLLPQWWTLKNFDRCIEMAKTDEDAKIEYAIEKDDLQEHYKQNDMPMQLRMVGEALDGTTIGGSNREGMLKMRVAMEKKNTYGCTSMLYNVFG